MSDILSQEMSRVTDSIEKAQKNPMISAHFGAARANAGLSDVHELGVQAGILNNFAKKVADSIDAPAAYGDRVNMQGDYGPYIPEVLFVVSAWYPDFPLRKLVSVQDMNQDLAYMFFSKLVTGTNKAPTIVGQMVETPTGMRTINGYYPTGEIFGETLPAEQLEVSAAGIDAITAYYALNVSGDYLKKFKLDICLNGAVVGSLVAQTVSGNKILMVSDPAASSNGSYMDIQSGAIFIAAADIQGFSASNAYCINANYVWNLDYAIPENIPKVKEEIEKLEMRAVPRAIGMEWTIFAEALRKSQFKKDFRDENTRRVLNLLYQYQVRYILDDMWIYSTATPGAISLPQSTAISLDVQAANVAQQLHRYSTQIEITTGIIEGNILVVGKNMKAFFESLPNTWFTPVTEPCPFSTAREIGKFSKYTVFYDPYRGDDEAFMTFKDPDRWWVAAYYMGMFLPITPTDVVTIGVKSTQSMVSMEAYKYWRPDAVIKLKVTYV